MADSADRRACWVCGETGTARVVCKKGEYEYVQCSHCSVVRQCPYPTDDETTRYYERYQTKKSAVSEYLTDAGFAGFVRDKNFTFADLGIDPRELAARHLCDVGCATGQFLAMLSSLGGKHLFGIDISDETIEMARARKLNCVQGNFLEIRETFDVITMWHVIEHLPRPRAFLQHAFDRLAPGGWLLVETPVVGPVAEAFSADWRYFMPVEHLNLFSRDALLRIGQECGFTVKSWTSFGSGNDNGAVPEINKRAMDTMTKRLGIGDTMAVWFAK